MSPETSQDPSGAPVKSAASSAPPTKAGPTSAATPLSSGDSRRRLLRRRVIFGAIALVLLAVGSYYGGPVVHKLLTTISTDDAYVNGHVTAVAARVPGQVTNVYVDDNYRVKKGSLLVQLDKEPYQIQVALKKAAYENTQANLLVANDEVRGIVAQARSNRFKLQHAIEDVDNQVALLRADIATLKTRRATFVRAKSDYERAIELRKTPGAIAPQDVDQRREAYDVAQAQVTQALESVYQIRVGLGLPAKPQQEGDDALGEVPSDLDQTYSTVRQALATLLQSVAPLNFFPASYDITPRQAVEQFYHHDPQGNLDRIYAKLVKDRAGDQARRSQARPGQGRLGPGRVELAVLRRRGRDRRRDHAAERQPGQQRPGGRGLDGAALADGNLGRRQLQRDSIAQAADRPTGRAGSRHVRQPQDV